MPTLVVHNAPRLAVGGRTSACSASKNSIKKQEPGCVVVLATWLPGATITYTVSYPNRTSQTFTATADGAGHAQHVFNIRYKPSAGGKRAPAVATIRVQGKSKEGAKSGLVSLKVTIAR
jgi:hypothetical protein